METEKHVPIQSLRLFWCLGSSSVVITSPGRNRKAVLSIHILNLFNRPPEAIGVGKAMFSCFQQQEKWWEKEEITSFSIALNIMEKDSYYLKSKQEPKAFSILNWLSYLFQDPYPGLKGKTKSIKWRFGDLVSWIRSGGCN